MESYPELETKLEKLRTEFLSTAKAMGSSWSAFLVSVKSFIEERNELLLQHVMYTHADRMAKLPAEDLKRAKTQFTEMNKTIADIIKQQVSDPVWLPHRDTSWEDDKHWEPDRLTLDIVDKPSIPRAISAIISAAATPLRRAGLMDSNEGVAGGWYNDQQSANGVQCYWSGNLFAPGMPLAQAIAEYEGQAKLLHAFKKQKGLVLAEMRKTKAQEQWDRV